VVKIVEMDKHASIFMQMEEDVGPVILIEKIKVDPEESDLFIKEWAAETEKFKKQPGFISTQLHKGYWWELHLYYLRNLGISQTFQEGCKYGYGRTR
jgi:Antibiotic biosynthesis monooxygenase